MVARLSQREPSTSVTLPHPVMIQRARRFQPTSLRLITDLHLLPALIFCQTPNSQESPASGSQRQLPGSKVPYTCHLSRLGSQPKTPWDFNVLKLPRGNHNPTRATWLPVSTHMRNYGVCWQAWQQGLVWVHSRFCNNKTCKGIIVESLSHVQFFVVPWL